MRRIVDFHIHSKYSRATSKNLDLREIATWARIKGLDIVSCGDFTHPKWFAEIEEELREDGSGFLTLAGFEQVKFLLGTEVACIYRHRDKTRRLHHLILTPTIESAKKINVLLSQRGAKLASDGRPILGMSSKELLTIILEADERNVLIPAHVWTPWFAIFGSKSGYDSVTECFEDLAPHIFALETGLSSDPEMNWALSQLDNYVLVSNSDAHSGPKLGREANVFDMSADTYGEMIGILKSKDAKRFLYTIEFFPEEGMYHYDGHRSCGVSFAPAETQRLKGICPRCKRPLTIGVLNRVDNLRDREFGARHQRAIPFKKIVPLPAIIADYYETSSASQRVMRLFQDVVRSGRSEFHVLLDADASELRGMMPESIADGIMRVRRGMVTIHPGYDGNYGTISLFSAQDRNKKKQQSLW